jgi:hypothetical protein
VASVFSDLAVYGSRVDAEDIVEDDEDKLKGRALYTY